MVEHGTMPVARYFHMKDIASPTKIDGLQLEMMAAMATTSYIRMTVSTGLLGLDQILVHPELA
jgi:hypothetical protein